MRSDKDKRTTQEHEIDDFLSMFDKPEENLSNSDVNSYLEVETSQNGTSFAWDNFSNEYNQRKNDSSKGELKTASSGLSNDSKKKEKTEMSKAEARSIAKKASRNAKEKKKEKQKAEKSFAKKARLEAKAYEKAISETRKNITDKSTRSERSKRNADVSPDQSKDNALKAKLKGFAVDTFGPDFNKEALIDRFILEDNPNYDPNKDEKYFLAGKEINNSQKKVSIKKLIKDVVGLCAAIVVCCMLYGLVCVCFAPTVNPDKIYTYVDTSSMIYDDEAKQVDSVYYTQNRKIIQYKEMPKDLINAFVSIEDKTFWKHHGFNWTRMVGAILTSFTGGGQISGTSTITQQLARNVYLADTKSVRSIKRKILEIYYAARIESAMSKEEIIEAYLNTIYLGYGCYGVDAASKSYFTKDVKDLNLIQCAALAALPQAPESYALIKYGDTDVIAADYTTVITTEPDTYVANDISKDRRDLTLDLMKAQGYIDDAAYNKYYGMDLIDFIKPTITKGAGAYSYFHEYLVDTVIADLMDKYSMTYEDAERMVYTQGLKIYSTMDSTAQEVVVKEFSDDSNFPSISGMYNKDNEGNIVSDNGTILLYDYDNFFDEDGNFTLSGDQVSINKDGSVTINDEKRLNVYTTEVEGGTDYSLEFKNTYKIIDGTLYSYQGGYVNIPSNYKSLDSDGNLKISADYFKDYPDQAKINTGSENASEDASESEEGTEAATKSSGPSVVFTATSYSLAQKTVQPQAAMAIVGVGTGEIKAMVGGRSTKGEKLLNRTLNPRQPGSSIKPLAVYGSALQKSYELEKAGKKWDLVDYGIDKQGTKGYGDYITTYSSVADERTHIEGRDWPKNSNNAYTGDNNFMTAIQQSINTCAVKIQLQIGNEFSMKMLKKFGLTTLEDDESKENNDMNASALALGGMVNGVVPLEMALAYASFPAGGKVNSPICYTKVVDRDGKTILESKSTQTNVMNEGVAWIMTEVLKSVVTKGIAGSAYVNNVQTGGKTGTTNDQYDIWFDGFTPTYAAALWIGTDNNIQMSSMSGPAAALWGRIMRQIPKAQKGKYKEKPANVISKNGYFFTSGTETGLSRYTPDKDKDDAAIIKAVDSYYLSHNCSIEEACAANGVTYAEYKEAGGAIPPGSINIVETPTPVPTQTPVPTATPTPTPTQEPTVEP